MRFRIGQRVRTTVDAPAGWEGVFSAPEGTGGVIESHNPSWASYGVVLDGDPDRMPAAYAEFELTEEP